MIGKTFLRLERDFDKHVAYCRDESNAQDFIATNDVVREFFEVSTSVTSITDITHGESGLVQELF